MELSVFWVPTFRKADLEQRLSKLAKKAVKYGNTDIKFLFGETQIREVRTENGPRNYEYISVSVSGEAPQISGWQFLARVELLPEENLIHRVPGIETSLTKDYRHHDGHCDHCNTLRARNDVYVLTNGTDQIAVGRSCLRDFLGIDDPKLIVQRAQFFEELQKIQNEDMLGSAGAFGYYDLKEVLLYAAAFIRTKGYVSKAKQAETGYETTGQAVQYSIRGVPGYDITASDLDRGWVEKTVQYFRRSESFGSEYLDNIRVLMKQDIIKTEHVALIASSVLAAQRALAPKPEIKESHFVGSVKERLKDLTLVLDKIIFLGSGAYGPTYLHLFKDSNGNVFSWITSSKLEVAEGASVKLDATVKEHKLYNGVKQTVLTRAKQLEGVN